MEKHYKHLCFIPGLNLIMYTTQSIHHILHEKKLVWESGYEHLYSALLVIDRGPVCCLLSKCMLKCCCRCCLYSINHKSSFGATYIFLVLVAQDEPHVIGDQSNSLIVMNTHANHSTGLFL